MGGGLYTSGTPKELSPHCQPLRDQFTHFLRTFFFHYKSLHFLFLNIIRFVELFIDFFRGWFHITVYFFLSYTFTLSVLRENHNIDVK